MHQEVERFLDKANRWRAEMTLLRELVTSIKELEEDYKWMHPCYTFDGKNVVLIHGFKEYFALLFHKGALLKDPDKLLIQQTENVQAARQMRFTDIEQIAQQKTAIKNFIKAAIEIEKSGEKVVLKETKDYPMPEEFRIKLDEDSELNKAFYALTPGRQRGYLFHFAQAKQAKTREARIEKLSPKILTGKGFDE